MGTGCDEVKCTFLIRCIEVIEKDASNTTALVTVGNEEILVTPFLELGVIAFVMFVACFLQSLMEMGGIFLVQVVRRKIGSCEEYISVRQ